VKDSIKSKLLNEKGSVEYYSILDKLKNILFTNNMTLNEISKTFDINLVKTPRINMNHKDKILTTDVLSQLFENIKANGPYKPIYIANDDVLFINKVEYFPPKQLKLEETEDAIRALLYTQAINNSLGKNAKEILNKLNNNTYSNYESFKSYKYEDKYDQEIMTIINSQPRTDNFISHKLSSGDYLLLKIDSFEQVIDNEKINNDNFYDLLDNTQSEGDYNSFYISKYNKYDIDVNEEYLSQ
jgi:hypothetical protein